jgi:hypothetical protein
MQYDQQRRPSRRDKKILAGRKAIGVLLLMCVVIAAVGYGYLSSNAHTRPTDKTTFCPTDAQGPNSVTAILIDRTDPFSLTQQAALRDRLNDLKDHTAKYDLLEIYSVEPTETKLLKPIFSMCNPGKGEDISMWTGNPHLIEERWQRLFDAPLQNMFNTILVGETAQISPIMESIQSIVVTRLGTQQLISKKIPRRLVVVSDLMQYVEGYTQYHPYPPFNEFSKSPYYQRVRSDLSGIDIDIWYVRRQSTIKVQGSRHLDFWRDYLLDQGGSIDKIWYVPGT